MTTEIHAFKAFDKNLKCRDFQYEIGKTYTHDGEVDICNSGFHSCKNPLDVWNYCPLDSRFCEVVASGEISRNGDGDTKIASAEIKITAEIFMPDIIARGIEWIFDQAKDIDSGYRSRIAASGDGSRLAASGDDSQIAASGDGSQIAASGYRSRIAASGDGSIAMSAGINSFASAGKNGCIVLTRWDGERYRAHVAYVGENGIKENTLYTLNNSGEFIEG